MSEAVIKVEGLSKKFCRSLKRSMFYGTIDVARSMFGIPYNSDKLRKSEFWAIDDISFELVQGETLGFLGKNGCGKSTMLRVLNGIFPPDKGKVTVKGSIGALIAVGVGFHPQMTGRENIFLNGTILGMKKAEIQRKLDQIIDFAEIGQFIDSPVNTYSSGMFARLGFSIAVHREPTILLIDEVLSVGDMAFGLKCQKKLGEYRQNGGTCIIVSHNMQLIRNTCNKAIWMDNGKILEEGEIFRICEAYEDFSIKNAYNNMNKDEDKTTKNILKYDKDCRIEKVELINCNNDIAYEFISGEQFTIRIYYQFNRKVVSPIIGIGMFNQEGISILENYSNLSGLNIESLNGSGFIDYTIKNVYLKANIYTLSVTLSESEQMNKIEWHEKAYTFKILSKEGININQGLIFFKDAKWSITNK